MIGKPGWTIALIESAHLMLKSHRLKALRRWPFEIQTGMLERFVLVYQHRTERTDSRARRMECCQLRQPAVVSRNHVRVEQDEQTPSCEGGCQIVCQGEPPTF